MPETFSALLTIFTIFSYATVTQNEEVDVYLNGNKIAQHQQQPQTIQEKRQQRREEILAAAVARRDEILAANQRAISETYLR
jgi:hypothetical protein